MQGDFRPFRLAANEPRPSGRRLSRGRPLACQPPLFLRSDFHALATQAHTLAPGRVRLRKPGGRRSGMLSQKAKYALRALVELARADGVQLTAGEIALRAD